MQRNLRDFWFDLKKKTLDCELKYCACLDLSLDVWVRDER